MRRTKLVNTIGPASNSLENLRKVIAAGSDVLRLNMSHGTPSEKAAMVKDIRRIASEEHRTVAVLADLQGPKIRVACFKNEFVQLAEGADFVLDADLGRNDGDEHQVGIDYRGLVDDVRAGDTLLLDDGRIVLEVTEVKSPKIFCKVKVGGELSDHKGINRLGGGLSANALTDKDREDLRLSVEADVDYIGISFVRSEQDIFEARKLIKEHNGRSRIIAKIERVEAIEPEVLRKIVIAADGIMIARGDLGVEIDAAKVPAAQRLMIAMAKKYHRPVITATQMLETMIHSMLPTRAEVSDVVNAVFDGTDAVMTSAETATGDHPIHVIKTMAHICEVADDEMVAALSQGQCPRANCPRPAVSCDCGCKNGCETKEDLDDVATEKLTKDAVKLALAIKAKGIITFTHNGALAFRLSAHNKIVPIWAFTDDDRTQSSMVISRNLQSFLIAKLQLNSALDTLLSAKCVNAGDKVVVVELANDDASENCTTIYTASV